MSIMWSLYLLNLTNLILKEMHLVKNGNESRLYSRRSKWRWWSRCVGSILSIIELSLLLLGWVSSSLGRLALAISCEELLEIVPFPRVPMTWKWPVEGKLTPKWVRIWVIVVGNTSFSWFTVSRSVSRIDSINCDGKSVDRHSSKQ